MGIQVRLELDEDLAAHVHAKTRDDGPYATVKDYIEALIIEDIERRRREFEAVKAELQRAFAAPEDSYIKLTAQDVIDRNRNKRAHAA